MENTIREYIRELVQLQKTDSHIMQIEESKGELPHKVDELQRLVNVYKENISKIETEIQENITRINHLNYELEDDSERQKVLQEKLYKVTNNREYNAFTQEIKFVDEKIEKDETLLLEVDLEKELNEEKLKVINHSLEERKIELYDSKKELKSKDNETAKEMKTLLKRKKQLELIIKQEVLSKKIYLALNMLS